MHFLSRAIFRAGWVVGSLELLGSPGGLARAMGSGLRDFINLPYRGLVQGPWAFLKGITHGESNTNFDEILIQYTCKGCSVTVSTPCISWSRFKSAKNRPKVIV